MGNPNFKGNKNSGRKTDAEIIRKYINLELANRIANKELKKIDEKSKPGMEELRTIVMPVVLKGMVEKKQIDFPKNIIDLIKNVKPEGDNNIPEENPN